MRPLAARPKASRPGRALRVFAALIVALSLAGPVRAESEEVEGVAEPPRPLLGEDPLFGIGSPIGPIEYRLGRGLQVGRTGLNIGGFTTIEFDREESEPGELAVDGLNFLLLWEPVDFFRAFAELEIDELFTYQTDGTGPDSSPDLNVQRLYGDFTRDDALSLRLGKFQTPVGRWNLVSAEPFVWTAIEPVTVELSFKEHATGLALHGTLDSRVGGLGYWLYGQPIDDFDAESDEVADSRGIGGRLELVRGLEDWSLGASWLSTERDGDWSHLGGLDAAWSRGRFGLSSELVYQDGDIRALEIWGGYVQATYELLPSFFLVGRYEHFDPAGSRNDSDLGDLGFLWNPLHFIYFKASYRLADEQTEDVRRGVNVSLSVIF